MIIAYPVRNFARGASRGAKTKTATSAPTTSISQRLEEARLSKEKMEQAERMEKQGPMSIFGKDFNQEKLQQHFEHDE